MILLTGAAGKTGHAILTALRGVTHEPIRALVRRSSQQEEISKLGAEEAVVGDFLEPEDLSSACRGIRAVYHLCPNVSPHEILIGENILAAAREAGVEHFVYHSVLHPQTEAMPHHWRKLRVEELMMTSGLPFTILQPTAYMQNLLAHWPSISTDGVLPLLYPPQTRISLVDLGDVAEVAAKGCLEQVPFCVRVERTGKGVLVYIGYVEQRACRIDVDRWLAMHVHTSTTPLMVDTFVASPFAWSSV